MTNVRFAHKVLVAKVLWRLHDEHGWDVLDHWRLNASELENPEPKFLDKMFQIEDLEDIAQIFADELKGFSSPEKLSRIELDYLKGQANELAERIHAIQQELSSAQ